MNKKDNFTLPFRVEGQGRAKLCRSSEMATICDVLTLQVKLTTMSTRFAMALINAQTHLLWVFGSMVPADAPTVEHPGLCLGHIFIKWRAQSRCFGRPPSGRRKSLSSCSHFFLTTSMLVPKNSRKCRVSVVAAQQTRRDVLFWMSRANALKSGMVMNVAMFVLADFIVRRLAGGHCFGRQRLRRRRRRGGEGEGERELEVSCCVMCVVCCCVMFL